MKKPNRKIILESGEEFYGYAFGADAERIGELVFNTSMVGYQEILSDPSYTDQAIVMTYPLIGNYGISDTDFESEIPTAGAMIVREYNPEPSHFRCTASLGSVLERFGIPGVSGIDTRRLTRIIRDRGSCMALIASADTPLEEGLIRLSQYTAPRDAVSRVSSRTVRVFPAARESFHVLAIDCGIKRSMIEQLNDRGCRVTLVPWNTPADEILAKKPDGLLISNGPGDPTDVPEVIDTVRALLGKLPIFGICLGHQILSLAYGAETYKLKFGHRGGNHPVRDLQTGKIEITAQNHSYAVDRKSLERTPLELTHINLLDGTVEGVRCVRDGVFGVQYHPESAPGPEDCTSLFDRMIRLLEEFRYAEKN